MKENKDKRRGDAVECARCDSHSRRGTSMDVRGGNVTARGRISVVRTYSLIVVLTNYSLRKDIFKEEIKTEKGHEKI